MFTNFIIRFACFRDFINTYYLPLKQTNPKCPILVRECEGVQPKLWARFGEFPPPPPIIHSQVIDVFYNYIFSQIMEKKMLWL